MSQPLTYVLLLKLLTWYLASIRLKDAQLRERDAQLKDKDAQLKDKDMQMEVLLKEKDARLKEKDARLKEKDTLLKEKDTRLKEKDMQIDVEQERLRKVEDEASDRATALHDLARQARPPAQKWGDYLSLCR
jgi:chromosome segregation ATPase